jgi:hypothetical protein
MISGIVRYQTKPRQSGIFLVHYRTEIIDAGMPMPALSFLDADAQLCLQGRPHLGGIGTPTPTRYTDTYEVH